MYIFIIVYINVFIYYNLYHMNCENIILYIIPLHPPDPHLCAGRRSIRAPYTEVTVLIIHSLKKVSNLRNINNMIPPSPQKEKKQITTNPPNHFLDGQIKTVWRSPPSQMQWSGIQDPCPYGWVWGRLIYSPHRSVGLPPDMAGSASSLIGHTSLL